jgi:hypothetical protein
MGYSACSKLLLGIEVTEEDFVDETATPVECGHETGAGKFCAECGEPTGRKLVKQRPKKGWSQFFDYFEEGLGLVRAPPIQAVGSAWEKYRKTGVGVYTVLRDCEENSPRYVLGLVLAGKEGEVASLSIAQLTAKAQQIQAVATTLVPGREVLLWSWLYESY